MPYPKSQLRRRKGIRAGSGVPPRGDTEWEAWKAKAVRVCWTEPWKEGSPRSVLCMRGSIVPEARRPPRGSKGVMPRTQARCEK